MITEIWPEGCLIAKQYTYIVSNKNYLLYNQNSELNRQKNLQAMQHICHKHNVPFYYDLLEDFADAALARDLLHCGADAHEKLANKFLQFTKDQWCGDICGYYYLL